MNSLIYKYIKSILFSIDRRGIPPGELLEWGFWWGGTFDFTNM